MSNEQRDALRDDILGLAIAVGDGHEVDWTLEEERLAHCPEHAVVRSLHLLSRISALHRSAFAASPSRSLAIPAVHAGTDKDVPGVPDLGSLAAVLSIVRPLGAGSFGRVFVAHDSNLHRDVALKLIPRAPAGRPLREAQRLAQVRHPNVVTVYGAQELDSGAALWMELVSGQTLGQRLRTAGTLGASELVAVGTDLCRALAAVHQAGLLHQDIKAENVMREEGGRIVLMDFGPGAATPMYMAPELLAGGSATVTTDLYAVGVLLFYLATAEYPLPGASLPELSAAHARGARASLRDRRPDLPTSLVAAIDRALHPDPAHRYASAGAMEAELAQSRALPRRHRRSLGIAATLCGVALGLLLLWQVREHGARQRALARLSGSTDAGTAEVGTSPPTPAAVAVSYTAQASLLTGAAGRSLRPGERVAVGDSLGLRFLASTALFVYVVDEDDAGASYLLYPLSGLTPQNPLAGGQAHALPGWRDGHPFYWQVTSPGGQEHVIVVASPTRLVGFETEMLTVARATAGHPLHYAQLTPRAKEQLRGIGGVLEGAPDRAGPVLKLAELAAPLPAGPERVAGVWIRRIDLRNPSGP